MRPFQPSAWANGFTLAEVVVAVVLIQIGVLGSAAILTQASRVLARAEELEVGVATLAAEVWGPRAEEIVGLEPVCGDATPLPPPTVTSVGNVSWGKSADGTIEVGLSLDGRHIGVVVGRCDGP